MTTTTMVAVLHDVAAERMRQDDKWGEQNPPSIDPLAMGDGVFAAQLYGIPRAVAAKTITDWRFKQKIGSWADIALEEFCESIEAAAEQSAAELRVELIQTAAVIVAWVEYLDRQPKDPE